MRTAIIDRTVFTDVSWWHWAVTVPLLAAGVAGHAGAVVVAAVFCVAVGTYFFSLTQSMRPYPMQVRVAYLALLTIGTLPGMAWVHWVQLIGTTAMVTVGYCPLLRLLSVLPFNRTCPLSLTLLWNVFVRQPSFGGLMSLARTPQGLGVTCSVRAGKSTACGGSLAVVPRGAAERVDT